MTDNLRMFEDLVGVETRLWNRLDGVLSDTHGLPLAWLFALRVVQGEPNGRIQDLATRLDITPGGASKLVDRLVAAGYLERIADGSDRRVSRLALTAAGRRAVRAGSKTSEAWLSDRFAGTLGSPDSQQLAGLLRALSAGDHAGVGGA